MSASMAPASRITAASLAMLFALPDDQRPAAESWPRMSLKGLAIGAQVETWPRLRGGDGRVGARGQSSGA